VNAPEPTFTNQVAITVVLASEGYPDTKAPDRPIEINTDQEICHASTRADLDANGNTTLFATGGRVLSVVATGKNFTEARTEAYEALTKIHLEGSHFRSDIAKKVIN
jgi:phosphoribosylamine--glycine ligase